MADNENKQEKFKRIATKRANRILRHLRLLGNCSNSRVYGYTNQQVNHIFNIVDEELKRVKNLFKGKKRKEIKL